MSPDPFFEWTPTGPPPKIDSARLEKLREEAEQGVGGAPRGLPRAGSPHGAPPSLAEGGSLVTSRNNSHTSAFRVARAYVQACGKGTLALHYEGSRVDFGALACGSWSCPHCRKRLAARLLDRLRRGMESRERVRHLVTLTVDPSSFGAHRVGSAIWDDGRQTTLWSEPTAEQFAQVSEAMSAEWDKVNRRLRLRARRAGLDLPEYFRVVELHRNGWPHYHVVYENLVGSVEWDLGRVDVRPVDLDGAVGEVAPYLVCAEKKAGGHKAYQFAANALPAGFRLWSSSRGFLSDAVEPDGPSPTHGVALRGHFTGYHQAVREMGADSRLVLYAPTDADHVPPSRSQATGDAAVVYYAELVYQAAMHADPHWLRPTLELMDRKDDHA